MSATNITFVIGGARSGKSRFAEKLCIDWQGKLHYLATGRAWDGEMEARIAKHRQDRGPGWITHETPLSLVDIMTEIDDGSATILIDCLTLWVTNLMMEDRDMAHEFDKFIACIGRMKAHLVIVSNEVGLGIVPENAMARAFRDHAGRLHQRVAEQAATVYFIAAGLPLKMKG